MTAYRPYIALFDRSGIGTFSKEDTAEIKRVLGDDTSPLMGIDGMSGFAIAFISINSAQDMVLSLGKAIGPTARVAVLELGQDQSQIGFDHHHKWLRKIGWMTKEKNREIRS